MLPPREIYSTNVQNHFDKDNRPYHHLFYTTAPNYYSTLHVSTLHFFLLQYAPLFQIKFFWWLKKNDEIITRKSLDL